MTTRVKRIVGHDRAQSAANGARGRLQPPSTRLRGSTVATANQTLAESAGDLASRAPAGSLARKAAGCVAVALSTTGTIASARRVLGMVTDAEVQAAARELLGHLATPDQEA